MKKKLLIILLVLLLCSSSKVYCNENKDDNSILDQLINEIYTQYNLDQFDMFYQENVSDVMNISSLKEFIWALVKGEIKWDLQMIIEKVKLTLFKELSANLNLLAKIIFLAVMAAILKNISSAFGKSQVNEIAFYVVYLILIGLIIQCFYTAITLAGNTIDSMIVFIKALLPTMLILIASLGAVASSTVLSPLFLFVVSFTGTAVNDVVYPLIIGSSVVNLINYISPKINISKLAQLLKQAAFFVMGFLFIIFLGVISIQSITLTTLDGVSVKTAKYAIEHFIPFVGGFLADSIDTILNASILIKNAVGVAGLILVVAMIAFPVIKIFAMVLMFKISAAIIQPISDERIVNCISDIANYILMIVACVIVIAVMFFILITLIIVLGDVTVMYR